MPTEDVIKSAYEKGIFDGVQYLLNNLDKLSRKEFYEIYGLVRIEHERRQERIRKMWIDACEKYWD